MREVQFIYINVLTTPQLLFTYTFRNWCNLMQSVIMLILNEISRDIVADTITLGETLS